MRYRVLEPIGKGGMGEVFLAEDTELQRKVALKFLPEALQADTSAITRLRREAKSAAALDHPYICKVYEVGETEDGRAFIAMEYVEGETLARRIESDPLPLRDTLRVASEMAEALEAAHERNIVHRDLKPANVMLGPNDHVKVMDFGLAKEIRSDATESEAETRSGGVVGTPGYMSPEQLRGAPVDVRSDLFGFGVVLQEMLTGIHPFRRNSSADTMAAILKEPPTGQENLPSVLQGLLKRLLAKQAGQRPLMGELRTELARLVEHPTLLETKAARQRPFVGRESEFAELEGMVDRMAAGTGGIVLLGGEPGVGKTRLAEEVLANARERGCATLVGRNYEEGAAPFIPLVEMLEHLAETVPSTQLRDALGDYAPDIARLTPALQHRFPDLPEPAELPPEVRRRYLFNGLLELLRKLSRNNAYVLLLDDLHWADDASLALVEHVASHLASLPVLMIGTYRDVELEVGKPFEKTLATLVRQRLATRLSVGRLPEERVGELLAALGGPSPPAPLVSAIFQETEGNPFFVEEVFAHLSEEDKLFDPDGAWKTDLIIDELEVPEGVRLVIGRRLERLSPGTPRVLTTAGLVGRRFELAVVEAVPGWDDDQVLEAIEESESAKLVRGEDVARTPTYSFTHELIRQTLLGSLSLPRRQRLHLRIADAIESTYSDRLDEHAAELGRHLYLAGGLADETKTVRYLDLAGRQALAGAAYEEALRYCEDALSLLDDGSELQAEKAGLLFRRALANKGMGHREGVEADLRAAFDVNERLGRMEEISDVSAELAYFLVWSSRPDEAEEYVKRALVAIGDGDSPARCRLLSRLGFLRGILGDAKSTLAAADETLAMANRLQIPRLSALVWTDRATNFIHAGQIARVVDEADRAFELQRAAGAKWELSHTQLIAVLGWLGSSRFDRLTDERLDEYERLAQQVGYFGQMAFVQYGKAARRFTQGDFRVAAPLRQAVDFFDQEGGAMSAEPMALLGLLQLWQGREEESLETFELVPHEKIVPVWRGWVASHQLLAMAYRGDRDTLTFVNDHRALLPIAGEPNPGGAWLFLPAMVEALALLGERRQASELYPLVRELLQNGAVMSFAAGLGLVERTAGIAAAAGGSWSDAEAHFERARRQADEFPHRIDQADVPRWWAWMLLDRDAPGDQEQARELLIHARGIYDELGMAIHSKIAAGLLDRV